ncbi:MAG: ferrochelatase [Propionibacteriaceae bacterium]|nr:ferrochelatase [Propionibacteriaceae bacterium]
MDSSTSNRAVVLANLGTPDSPDVADVRAYLRQFLSDRRIVAAPRAFWIPFLHLILLRFYAPKSAARYASIWTPDGSPQRINTQRQADGLQARLGDGTVRYAMRYGSPSIDDTLTELRAAGVTQVLMLSLFPQFSTTTTASLHDDLDLYLGAHPSTPDSPLDVTWVDRWGDDQSYIEACAARIEDSWQSIGRPDFSRGDKLVLSFHGVPVSCPDASAYHDGCQRTADLLLSRLGLTSAQALVTFQSKFGPGEWLTPATIATMRELGPSTPRVDVFCPGFAADCLETIEEIGQLNRAAFIDAGGQEFNRIDCLNDHPVFVSALLSLSHVKR